jgi:phosphatidate cytidylyltransferase
MLRTRAWIGSLLAALTLGMFFLDNEFAPWYPILYGFFVLAGIVACHELRGLFSPNRRPHAVLCHWGVQTVVAVNWVRPIHEMWPSYFPFSDPWQAILGTVVATMLAAFLWEMATYQEPGEGVARTTNAVLTVVYLGVLASFLAQLRWLPTKAGSNNQAVHALMLAVFVPKCCDVGAYCSGRLFGRHRMTPRLSPKKTWEGAAGGLLLAIVTAIGVSWFGNRPSLFLIKAIAFGVSVAVASMFGDLAESLVKREGQKKDASQSLPGFGGVLDVIDSLLFAAPLAYVWLTAQRLSPLG